MSVGGAPLGTLLIQRLDTALALTSSQQSTIVSGTRPDAVGPLENSNKIDAPQNETLRHPREAVDRTTAQASRQGQEVVDKAILDARRLNLSPVRDLPNTGSTPSAPTTLGQAAKTILALLANYPGPAPAVIGDTLVPGPAASLPGPDKGTVNAARSDTDPSAPTAAGATGAKGAAPSLAATVAAFVQGLSLAVQSSGLFYESHLNDLAFGKQSIDSLLQEPQGKINQLNADNTNPANTRAETARAEAPRHGWAPADVDAAAHTSAATSAGALSTLHPETHLLVRQQLETLANQAFVWSGEAWPNTPIQWELARHEQTGSDSGATPDNHWATRIKLTMPNLGEVEAKIKLIGQRLTVHLVATSSAQRLNEHSEALRSRYLASGLQLGQLFINTDPPVGRNGET